MTRRPGAPGALLARRWHALTGSAPAAAAALGLLACLCTLLAVAGPRAAAGVRNSALRQIVAGAPETDKSVVASTGDSAVGVPDGFSAGQIQLAKEQLRRNLHGLPLAPAAEDWSNLTTPAVGITDHAAGVLQAALPPEAELSYRDTLASNVRVVAGQLPAGQPGNGATTILQAAVTAPTARRFGIAVGSRLALPGTGIAVSVTAIVRPRDPAAPFWTVDPTVADPQLGFNGQYDFWIGGFFIPADGVSALRNRIDLTTTEVTWTFPLNLSQLTAPQASQLQQTLTGALATAGNLISDSHSQLPVSVPVTSGTGSLLATFNTEAASVGNVLDLLSASLAVLAATVVLLAGWLLAEHRRRDLAVLRARGAARRHLALVILGGSVVSVLPGAAAGVAIAVALTPGTPVSLSWWLAGLVVLVALAGPAGITAAVHRGYAQAARPDDRPGRLAAARRVIVEAAMVLGAVGGLVVLRDQGLGAGGQDLYASTAPALLAVGVAVIVLRAYPPLLRGLVRLASRRAGATAFLGLARATRVPASAALPAFAMVLALALVSFAGMVRGGVIRGEVAASWQQAGADAVITTKAPAGPALQRAVAVVPGVSRVASAFVGVGSTESAGNFTVLLADPAQYAAVLAAGPLPQPPPEFTGAATGGAGPAPVLASPGLAAALGHGPFSLLLDGQQPVRVRVVGQAPGMSAVATTSAGYLVLNRRVAGALGTQANALANALLVAGPAVNQPALRTAVARHAAGATIVFRSQLLAGLQGTPLRRGAYLALLLGAIAAACCGLLVLLLSLLLTAAPRQQVLARMAAMGLSAAQAGLLVFVELLPQLLAVLAGGLACAVALVPALGPELSLAAFTGSDSSVPVHLEPAWLVASGLALLVLALGALAGQTLLTDRDAAGLLRIDE